MALSECDRLGMEIECNRYADASDVLAEEPDIGVVATGGLLNLDSVHEGQELATTSWDILGGTIPVAKSVLLYDDAGSHAAMTTAEFVIEAGASPHKENATVTMNLRIDRLERRGNKIAAIFLDNYTREFFENVVDQAVVENGTKPIGDVYFALKPLSKSNGEVDYNALIGIRPQDKVKNPTAEFRLFRIGDAVASRNIHAASYDGHRFMAAV
ncbi:MAG: hypothetical protein EOS41_07735 [Mesorhizobium sp.]|uniref:hypothetical protein n=1 Tax=Mesorhizobium sp. TaxID=1871066 RepID=UPI000FE6EA00|nr:hypothetical protein [Mesorhizobium sp.]RWE26377.1 MAG: hypothetical protein EOS41_07735 [Mesorhizobium sp.]